MGEGPAYFSNLVQTAQDAHCGTILTVVSRWEAGREVSDVPLVPQA